MYEVPVNFKERDLRASRWLIDLWRLIASVLIIINGLIIRGNIGSLSWLEEIIEGGIYHYASGVGLDLSSRFSIKTSLVVWFVTFLIRKHVPWLHRISLVIALACVILGTYIFWRLQYLPPRVPLS